MRVLGRRYRIIANSPHSVIPHCQNGLISTDIVNLIKKTCVAVFLLPIGSSASAYSSDQQQLYGEWGNESQCARALITPKGTKRFSPFEVRPDWLGHGDVWCRLTWTTVRKTQEGVYAVAGARCGEDTVRDYEIIFSLINDELSLTWNRGFQNGPLERCSN